MMDRRNLFLTFVALGMAGGALFLPAGYTLGKLVAPGTPVAATAHAPAAVRSAIWARASGVGEPHVDPLTPWSVFSFATCNVAAVPLSGSRDEERTRMERCVEDQAGLLMAGQVSRLYMDTTNVPHSPRWALSQVATMARLTREWDADALLDTLATTSPFGRNKWRGVDQASQAFFGHAADQLSPAEATLLSVQIPDPADLDPWCHPDRAKSARDAVLAKMKRNGALDQDSFESAVQAPLGVVARQCAPR
jgi:Transglycosylase